MGLEDLVSKAKDALGGAEDKAVEATAAAEAGAGDQAESAKAESKGLIDKAKALLTDDKIDMAAGMIKTKTPNNIDTMIDTVSSKAKQMND